MNVRASDTGLFGCVAMGGSEPRRGLPMRGSDRRLGRDLCRTTYQGGADAGVGYKLDTRAIREFRPQVL